MSSDRITPELTGSGILTVRLNRPERRNALDIPTLEALTQTWITAASDNGVRCVVLAAQGPLFCSGADTKEWAAAAAAGQLETYGWTQKAHRMMGLLRTLPKPTLAVLQGDALGAGLDLALACDLRIAAHTARLRAGYTQMAYAPDAGSSWHLPRLIGLERAKRFLFLDQGLDARTAQSWGLLGDVCDGTELNVHAEALALALASAPTVALGQTKRLLDASAHNTFEQQLNLEQEAGLICGRSQDAEEALRASIERRSPLFQGA